MKSIIHKLEITDMDSVRMSKTIHLQIAEHYQQIEELQRHLVRIDIEDRSVVKPEYLTKTSHGGMDISLDPVVQKGKRRIRYKDVYGEKKQLWGGTAYCMWKEKGKFYHLGGTCDNPMVYYLNIDDQMWSQCNRYLKEEHVKCMIEGWRLSVKQTQEETQ